ncbi:hypothetical protein [Desulfurispira natronophila]|uniref:Uncharacterized protein n=1 Tax=Desulfurispira natronophila TaxID=682562 RepID=A0A7W7Y635_9BACT|nr:hypothetical protein [Desulfurispira natronophila]MBB5022783.1 hypothetical protein [Desulfurispira natronophila]
MNRIIGDKMRYRLCAVTFDPSEKLNKFITEKLIYHLNAFIQVKLSQAEKVFVTIYCWRAKLALLFIAT